jgi:hypothetical protein
MRNRAFGVVVAAGVVGAAMIAGSQAQAAIILSGNSNTSSFSNCIGTGCPSGSSQSITLGSTAGGGGPSTLSILSNSFSATGATTGLNLADLSLVVGQKPGAGEGTLSFSYNIVLTFTIPSGSTTDTIALALSGNGSGGSNGVTTLSGLVPTFSDPLNLSGGLTLSNFRFVDVGSDGAFSNGNWTVDGPAGDSAQLELLADISVTSGGTAAVPEPSTLTIFGAGLAMLCVMRRKRKAS